jgi:hypothetical protein
MNSPSTNTDREEPTMPYYRTLQTTPQTYPWTWHVMPAFVFAAALYALFMPDEAAPGVAEAARPMGLEAPATLRVPSPEPGVTSIQHIPPAWPGATPLKATSVVVLRRAFIPAMRVAFLGLSVFCSIISNAAGQTPSPATPYYYFVHWMSVGRLDLALDQFAEDAVVVAGPACTEASPCVGRAAIQSRYLGALASGLAPLPVTDQHFDGRRLRTRGETIAETTPETGGARLRGGHVFELRDGRIVSIRADFDRSDPQTAAFLARRETHIDASRR